MNLFSKPKCPNCQKPIPEEARFCPSCGTAVGGGERRCGVCGAVNRSDAVFCGNCGKPLAQSEAPEIIRHRWTRTEDEFAVRIEADDLPGRLKKGVLVEPGTNAMVIEHGANRGLLPPGEYTLTNVSQHIKDWLTGSIPESTTFLLVGVVPTDLEFNLGGRYTREPLPIGVALRVTLEVSDPGKFLVNVLRGRERLTKEEVREFLYPEVVQVVDRWLREHTLQELVDDPGQRARLELALDEALRATLAQTGLRLLQVRTTELNLEPYDEIKGVRGRYNLLNARALAELDGRRLLDVTEAERLKFDEEEKLLLAQIQVEAQRNWIEVERSRDLNLLADETRKVETEEKKVNLYHRMRQAVMSEKMNEVRTEADLKKFLQEIEVEELLSEKEREELLRTWREEAEDHQKRCALLAAKMEVEGDYELRLLKLKLQREADAQVHLGNVEKLAAIDEELDNEIVIARKRADWDFELRRRTALEEVQIDIDARRIQDEYEQNKRKLERLESQQELADDVQAAKLGLEILAVMKANQRLDEEERRRIDREDVLIRARENQKFELEKMEAVERQRQAERDHELRRIESLAKLGTEALISVSGSEQAKILADLKRTETLKGMSEEQILAMAAERSPAVAEALKEKFRLIADGKVSKVESEMYERLLGEQKETLRQLREESDKRAAEVAQAWEKSSGQTQTIAEKALDRMADVAKGQSGQIVIVMPSGEPQIINTRDPGEGSKPKPPKGTKICLECGQFSDVAEKFCRHCGHEFKGMA